MPKMKTRKAAAKRFHVTGSGKIRFKKSGLRHILTKKSSKRKSDRRKPGFITSKTTEKTIKVMMPYAN